MSTYKSKLAELIEIAQAHPGTGGQRALIAILGDMDGKSAISELLHTLDKQNFAKVIELFIEFRRSGRRENYNELHFVAKQEMRRLADDGGE